jgi:hypothetical protein
MTPSDNNSTSGTQTCSNIEKFATNTATENIAREPTDTCNTSVTVGATVPSSLTAQAVWLRYNPQRVRKGSFNTTTEL